MGVAKIKLIIFFLILRINLYSEGFCTTKNLQAYCGVGVLEYQIDSASISPALNCSKIFFWIPLFSASGEEKCYICSDTNSLNFLQGVANTGKPKRCGKIVLAGKL